jgi:hypothetical protein
MSIQSRSGRLSRPTLAATLILAACAIVSFGFVLQRGSLLLPEAEGASPTPSATPTGGVSGAVAGAAGRPSSPAPTPLPTASGVAAGSLPSAAGGATASASPGGPASSHPAGGGAPSPSAAASAPPAAGASPAPTSTPLTTSPPSPGLSPGSGGPAAGASTSRLALLTPCRSRADCYVYSVRRGDNLWSIVHWFGVDLERVRRLNPWIGPDAVLRAGQKLILPTPTR